MENLFIYLITSFLFVISIALSLSFEINKLSNNFVSIIRKIQYNILLNFVLLFGNKIINSNLIEKYIKNGGFSDFTFLTFLKLLGGCIIVLILRKIIMNLIYNTNFFLFLTFDNYCMLLLEKIATENSFELYDKIGLSHMVEFNQDTLHSLCLIKTQDIKKAIVNLKLNNEEFIKISNEIKEKTQTANQKEAERERIIGNLKLKTCVLKKDY